MVPMGVGTGASRGFVTAAIYSAVDPLSERVAGEAELADDLRHDLLVSLATAGGTILAQVASDPKRWAEMESKLQTPALIPVSGEQSEVQIPWEIVYDRPLPSMGRYAIMQKAAVLQQDVEIDIEGFWGFKHIIERPLTSGYEKAYTPSPPEIPVQERPVVNLGLDMGAPEYGRVRETFEAWAEEGRIDLASFDYPPDFQEALVKRPADIYVLHGRGGEESGEIWIDFGKERLTRRLLESWRTGQRGSALFYLDVSAGLGRGNDWWAWLDLFREMGAGGVVAPMVTPHPNWSPDFMARFMDAFLEGEEAGAALRQARREFFEATGNPMGLLYVHFGPAAQRLVRPGENEDREEGAD